VNYDTFVRLTAWMALSAVFWIAGGFASGEVRLVLWILGMSIELIAPAIGYWTPGLGASRAADWRIDGDHIAERCALFVIIALGETILTAGATFAGLDWGAGVVTACTIIFLTTAAMWWSYFGSLAGSARRVIGTSSDPGGIARLGYTYLHLPIVAGIIAAAASFELLLTHPLSEPAEGPLILSLVGGSSLYLAGLSLFSRTTVGKSRPSHLAGIGALVVLGATCLMLSPSAIVTAAATASILILAAAWETISAPAREMWHAAD
jgi:low temperature requirement protein LtrA